MKIIMTEKEDYYVCTAEQAGYIYQEDIVEWLRVHNYEHDTFETYLFKRTGRGTIICVFTCAKPEYTQLPLL